jgi:hypothetical protein
VVDGEPHLVRDDFGVAGAGPEGDSAAGTAPAAAAAGRPLLCLVHLTDVQLADVQSPTRFEFLNRYFADPRYAEIIPVQRPQEALTAHAVDAMLRTVNALRGPATGAPLRLAVTTGDAIDNAQWNELQTFLALLDGGRARVHRAEPAGRHRPLRPRHPGRPADRAGHHLPGRRRGGLPRPPAGPLAGRAAGRGAFGLPGARRARRQHRPRGPFGHRFLPPRNRDPDQ